MTEERFVKDTQYRELRPANVYDVAANETWLEDMARQGYRLVGMTGWSGIFEEAEPCACRYRMQPLFKKEKRPPEEMAEAYRELGWEYAGTIPETFHVWCCQDPAASELDTDPVVQGMGYRYLRRKMRKDLISSLLLLAVLAALCVFLSGITTTPLLDTLEQFAPGQLTVGTLAAILLVVLMTCQMRSMRRLLRFLDAGIPLERPRPYRRQKWLARALAAVLGLSLVLHFLGGLTAMDGGSLKEGWDAGDSYRAPGPGVLGLPHQGPGAVSPDVQDHPAVSGERGKDVPPGAFLRGDLLLPPVDGGPGPAAGKGADAEADRLLWSGRTPRSDGGGDR